MPVRNQPRYAHSEGLTDVCFSPDGRYIVTCGSDGDVRLWEGCNHDDEPLSHCVGDKAYALSFSGSDLLVSTDCNAIQSFSFPDFEKNGVLSTFTAPVNQIVVSSDGKKVVGGSSDMTVKVYDRSTSDVLTISGHKGPILGVSVDPEFKYVATSSSDGTVRVWSSDTLKCIKIWSCLPSSNSVDRGQILGRTSWFPISGRYIAVPDNNGVYLYEKDTWIQSKSLVNESVSEKFSVAAFSPSGQYLAASTFAGEICVWNVSKTLCVSYTQHNRQTPICSLAWNPLENGIIAVCDWEGLLGIDNVDLDKEQENSPKGNGTPTLPNIGEEEEDDDEFVISLEKIKASVGNPVSNILEQEEDTLKDDTASESSSGTPAVNLQAPFQPSSTPERLQHRFMVWNSVGIVRSHKGEEEESVIEVEFHDRNLHHPIQLPNTSNSSIASLSEQLLMLGSRAVYYTKIPSKIMCILINSWDGTKSWNLDLPDGEEVLAMACTNTWAAAATDVRNLRLFSIMGTQREIVCLPGPVVCLSGYEDMLLVIFYHGSGLSFMLLSVLPSTVRTIISFEPLPVSPRSTLQWAGFTDEGTPCTMDSAGVVRIFTNRRYWVPICDTSSRCSGPSDHYFVLGVSEKHQNVRCILCRGNPYPPTIPHPTVIEFSLSLPVCEPANEKSELEEKWQRSQVLIELQNGWTEDNEMLDMVKEEAEKTVTETVIRLFALACRSGLDQKAVELCNMMSSYETVQMALRYASKLGKSHLAERISDIATEKKTGMVSSQSWKAMSVIDRRQRFGPSIYNLNATRRKVPGAEKNFADEIDPFALTQEVESAKEKILISLREKIVAISDTPPSGKPERMNPFKKLPKSINSTKVQKEDAAERVPIKAAGNANSPRVSLPAKETATAEKPSSTTSATKTCSFVQWFEKEKVNLKKEFPNLSVSELTRLAMKRFREQKTQVPSSSKDSNSVAGSVINGEIVEQPSSTDARKRKTDEESLLQTTPKLKLAKFVLKK